MTESYSDCFLITSQEEIEYPDRVLHVNRKGSAGCVVMLGKSFVCTSLHSTGKRLWVGRLGFELWLHHKLVLHIWTDHSNSVGLTVQICKAILSSKCCSETQLQ